MVCFGIASLLFAQTQASQVPAIDFNNLPYQDTVKRMADDWRAKYNLPGVWCAVIKRGKVVAIVATGVKNVSTGAPARIDDHFSIGSVSKVVTGSLISLFVAKGNIKYETKLGSVFPEFAVKFPNSPLLSATLRQFMTHMSGVPSRGLPTVEDKSGPENRLEALKRTLPLSTIRRPGETYAYSNMNPVIAVAMVERASQTTCEAWVNGPEARALGFNSGIHQLGEDNGVCPNYLEDGKVIPNDKPRKWSFNPAGSYMVTLADLCAFALSSISNSTGLPTDVYKETVTFPEGDISRHTSAGWGGNDKKYLMHNGDAGRGEYCEVWINPTSKEGVIFYSNISTRTGYKGLFDGSISEDLKALRLGNNPLNAVNSRWHLAGNETRCRMDP